MNRIFDIQANITIANKRRPVTEGFRPTLLFSNGKALSNISKITPNPLPSGQSGDAEISFVWGWAQPPDIAKGANFTLLEGERDVGSGVVLRLIRER